MSPCSSLTTNTKPTSTCRNIASEVVSFARCNFAAKAAAAREIHEDTRPPHKMPPNFQTPGGINMRCCSCKIKYNQITQTRLATLKRNAVRAEKRKVETPRKRAASTGGTKTQSDASRDSPPQCFLSYTPARYSCLSEGGGGARGRAFPLVFTWKSTDQQSTHREENKLKTKQYHSFFKKKATKS